MYSLSIIIPFIDELNSLKKTLKIITSRNKDKKEFLIIISKRKTSYNLINKLKNLKKKYNLKIYYQKRPFVGGAVKTGIKFSKNSHIVIMASDLETNPYDLKKMISICVDLTEISVNLTANTRQYGEYHGRKRTPHAECGIPLSTY